MISKDFNSIIELVKTFLDEQSCINHLEDIRWVNGIIGPFDSLSKDIDVTQKTDWFMLQRIRACFGISDNDNQVRQ